MTKKQTPPTPIKFWKAHRIKTFSIITLGILGYLFWSWQHHHHFIHSSKTPHKVETQIRSIVLPEPASTQ